MDHEHHGHDHGEDTSAEPSLEVPRGSSSYGWLWVVGIIVVVAIILFFLQGRVPEANSPEVAPEPPTAEETITLEEDGEDEPEATEEAEEPAEETEE